MRIISAMPENGTLVKKINLAMSLSDYVLKYWEFICFLAFIVFYGLWTYFKVGNHEERIQKLENEIDSTRTAISTLNERLGSMDAKLDILVAGYKKDNK